MTFKCLFSHSALHAELHDKLTAYSEQDLK